VARLSWHDAAEFDKRTYDMMGGDGCLDFGDTDSNAGLIEYYSLVNTYVEPMWQLVCDKISRGDFWNMIGNMVMELAEPTKQMKIPFYFGRKDSKLCRDGTGVLLGSTASTSLYNSVTFSKRLPTEQFGFPEILRVFVDQMGLTLADAGEVTVTTNTMIL
jgi:catalase (peroxidase I)